MPLPNLIEIQPGTPPTHVEISIPGSKSITNRALILAALAAGPTTLRGALWSEDTQVMTEALQHLGFQVAVEDDPSEICNRTITVGGLGGKIPNAGTESHPLELFVSNAGTAARFLAAFVCLGRGVYSLHGIDRMHQRPQRALFAALRELGYRVEPENSNDSLPVRIVGTGPRAGRCHVHIEESSQFASALLLCAGRGEWEIQIVGEDAEASPYVAMTTEFIRAFPTAGGDFLVEPDASSGSYFLAAQALLQPGRLTPQSKRWVANWPTSPWQIDARFPHIVPLPETLSRKRDLGDSIMTAMMLAPFGARPTTFTDLGRLRLQECERVAAVRTELSRCGILVREQGDTLEIHPGTPAPTQIETYNDHRMAMCFAILALASPGIQICNPACVRKTFPNFFQKIAAPPPHGLGFTVLDASNGRHLGHDELFAG